MIWIFHFSDEVYCTDTANSTNESPQYGECMKEVENMKSIEKSKRTWVTIVLVLAAFFVIFIGEYNGLLWDSRPLEHVSCFSVMRLVSISRILKIFSNFLSGVLYCFHRRNVSRMKQKTVELKMAKIKHASERGTVEVLLNEKTWSTSIAFV